VATTTNKAAKMQTSTNFTTTDDKPTKLDTTIDLDGPNITHYAPNNDSYKYLGSTGDNEEEELSINTAIYHTNQDTSVYQYGIQYPASILLYQYTVVLVLFSKPGFY
jgi:hypothetical protein